VSQVKGLRFILHCALIGMTIEKVSFDYIEITHVSVPSEIDSKQYVTTCNTSAVKGFGRLTIMALFNKRRSYFLRIVKIFVFIAAILITTKFTLEFGMLSKATTAAFSFLIIVLLSAFFGDLVIAIATSLVATLCYNYFYLTPVGTLNISAFSDWISLAAFLLASVIISHITASAAENKSNVTMLNKTLVQIKEFGEWLLSIPQDHLTLSKIAEETLKVFSLNYCSIHVYGEGKWQHYTGIASSAIPQHIENRLKSFEDHSTEVEEIADENMFGVTYAQINKGQSTLALLAVKSDTLPTDAIGAIAYMIGVRISATTMDEDS
jgi:two-component system sensor histidine kinase KdpD